MTCSSPARSATACSCVRKKRQPCALGDRISAPQQQRRCNAGAERAAIGGAAAEHGQRQPGHQWYRCATAAGRHGQRQPERGWPQWRQQAQHGQWQRQRTPADAEAGCEHRQWPHRGRRWRVRRYRCADGVRTGRGRRRARAATGGGNRFGQHRSGSGRVGARRPHQCRIGQCLGHAEPATHGVGTAVGEQLQRLDQQRRRSGGAAALRAGQPSRYASGGGDGDIRIQSHSGSVRVRLDR